MSLLNDFTWPRLMVIKVGSKNDYVLNLVLGFEGALNLLQYEPRL
jgi:hypothetical protein